MQDSSFIFTESTSSGFIRENENSSQKTPLLSQFNVHRGWFLFLLYYFSCYIALGFFLYRFVGLNYISVALTAFASIQLLRLIPSQGIREFVKKINYTCVLWFYRVNYLCTLSISISLCLAPFAACIYIASLYGTTASVLTGIVLLSIFLYVLNRRELKDNRAVEEVANTVDTTVKKTVAVIGGGVAGIVAAKEAMEEGHEVVVYEQASCFGGVWNSGDSLSKRTTGRTFSSSSRHNSFFGDFPMNSSREDNALSKTYPSHYSEADYREYLFQYTEHFDLVKLFKFNTSVDSTERTEDGKWQVKVRHQDGTVETNIHDFVIVSTGLNHQSHALKLSQTSNSNKLSMGHSATYRDKEDYRDKKVVIVGMGESSSDLAAEVASVAKEVHVIVRSPVLLLPRNTFGQNLAPDHKLSRLILSCPQYMRTWKLLSQTAMHGPLYWFASKFLGLKNVFGVSLEDGKAYDDNWSWEWWTLFYKLGFFHPKARWSLTRGQVTKTAPIVDAYRKGKLHFHTQDIQTLNDSSVLLENGSKIENVDALVNATGYTSIWPFLPAGFEQHDNRDRYRLVFHPELPNMAFVGFCRGAVGSVMQAMEMQSRWIALAISGKRQLPDKPQMLEKIAEHKQRMIGKWPTKVTMVYVNALARQEIGCEPKLSKLFSTAPKIWYYLIAGPYCNAMYRFRCPHAKPELARKVYEEKPQLVLPLEFYLQQVLELLLGYLTKFWSSVPPLKFFKQSNIACRTFVTPFLDLEY